MHRLPRSSPSATRFLTLLLAPVLVVGLLLGVLVTPAGSATGDHDRKKAIDKSISKLKADLHETSKSLVIAKAKYDAVHAKLDAARSVVRREQAKVDAAREKEAAIAKQLAAARAREKAAEAQLAAVEFSMQQTRDQINALARSAYERGRLSDVAVYLQAESPEDVTMRLAYTQSAVQSEDELLAQLTEQRAQVEARRVELAATREELVGLRLEAQRTVEVRLVSARKALAAEAEVAKLVRAADKIKSYWQRVVAREEARIAEAEAESRALQERLARRANTRNGGGYGGPSSSGLIWPTSGPITSPFGMRVHPITGVYKLHDGTDFAPGCGVPIRAAASGRVLSSFYSGAWGNRVIVEHGVMNGRSIATAYNHLSSSVAGPGQTVSQGQVIGYVGTTGYSTGCHLHLNVYANGVPVDPMGYL